MSDPFGRLRREREEREQAAERARQDEESRRAEEARINALRQQAKNEYAPLVSRVLGQLNDAAFGNSLRFHSREFMVTPITWDLYESRTAKYSDGDGNHDEYITCCVVEVELECSATGQATHFVCRGFEPVTSVSWLHIGSSREHLHGHEKASARADLSGEDLVRALDSLFSPGTAVGP